MSLLDEPRRARVAALADVLMPAGEGLPLPSAIDIQGRWIDMALQALPTMQQGVLSYLDIPGEPTEVLEKLQVEEPDAFFTLTFVLSGAYLMHPAVRNALGYEGLAVEPNPPLEGEAEYFLDDDLLAPVIARGSIYSAVPHDD